MRRYTPWRGLRYDASRWRGVRLLLLGESHYFDENENATIRWTRNYIEGGPGSFWTRVMQIVTGKHHSEIDRVAFWNDVGFYNYVQESVGEGARIRPTTQMWENAQTPFWQTLRELTPTHLLVLGKGLWTNLPSEGASGPDIHVGREARETWVYSIDTHRVLATWVYHPSSVRGSSAERSHPYVREFLRLSNRE